MEDCLVLASVALVCGAVAPPASAVPTLIAPINSNPLGQSYAEWAVDWWQWALETPTPINPLGSGTCESSQSGYFLFLRPLSPDQHTIHWAASGTCFGVTQEQDITYTIRVVG